MASIAEQGAHRLTDAPREEEVRDTYPGKGVDETDNVPPEGPGA